MLKESPALDEDDRRLCEIVQREAERLNHLVSDMMNLSSPRVPTPETIDIGALCKEVTELAGRAERAGDVAVVYQGPAEAVPTLCDGFQMRQVLWNLIRNGVQASAAHTRVVVSVKIAGADVIVGVTDQGEGIQEAAMQRLFDAFYTTRSHGTGIGLAVVKRIVDEHSPWGMSIEVASPQGGGAEFRIRMPVSVGPILSARPPEHVTV
jgi:signal transduction histidine kinase